MHFLCTIFSPFFPTLNGNSKGKEKRFNANKFSNELNCNSNFLQTDNVSLQVGIFKKSIRLLKNIKKEKK
jgi:hypothetical protein